jgi:hypothetical protein
MSYMYRHRPRPRPRRRRRRAPLRPHCGPRSPLRVVPALVVVVVVVAAAAPGLRRALRVRRRRSAPSSRRPARAARPRPRVRQARWPRCSNSCAFRCLSCTIITIIRWCHCRRRPCEPGVEAADIVRDVHAWSWDVREHGWGLGRVARCRSLGSRRDRLGWRRMRRMGVILRQSNKVDVGVRVSVLVKSLQDWTNKRAFFSHCTLDAAWSKVLFYPVTHGRDTCLVSERTTPKK